VKYHQHILLKNLARGWWTSS